MLVDIELKNGSILLDCVIFPENVKQGDLPYSSKEDVVNAFNKVPWGFKFVSFQNESINGMVHVNNVKNFTFHNWN